MKLLEMPLAKPLWYAMVKMCPKFCCKLMFYKTTGGVIDFNHPERMTNLDEKIQWLKFNADMRVWARLADKYAVREYVKECGLQDILVKLYGKYDTPEELMADWNRLPEKFVLKSNNGCGTVKIVRDKKKVDREEMVRITSKWLKRKDIGLGTVELHYTYIKPCLIVEELLEDTSMDDFSCSLVDYKLWCFNGKPFGCLVTYDRNLEEGRHRCDFYDLDWHQQTNRMTDKTPRQSLPRPQNYDYMLEVASKLSAGHPQMRVDLYNINGRVYFGELTMTAGGGYMTNYSGELLREMGEQVKLSH